MLDGRPDGRKFGPGCLQSRALSACDGPAHGVLESINVLGLDGCFGGSLGLNAPCNPLRAPLPPGFRRILFVAAVQVILHALITQPEVAALPYLWRPTPRHQTFWTPSSAFVTQSICLITQLQKIAKLRCKKNKQSINHQYRAQSSSERVRCSGAARPAILATTVTGSLPHSSCGARLRRRSTTSITTTTTAADTPGRPNSHQCQRDPNQLRALPCSLYQPRRCVVVVL